MRIHIEFLVGVLFVLLLPAAYGFGVSPAVLELAQTVPGGSAEGTVLLSSPFDDSWEVSVTGSEWLTVEPKVVAVRKGSPVTIRVRMAVPYDAAPGVIEQYLQFEYRPNTFIGEKSSAIEQRLRIPVTSEVTGSYTVSCVVGGVQLPAFEEGRSGVLTYSIKNTGSIRVSPEFTLEIGGYTKTWEQEVVLPTATQQGRVVVLPTLPVGAYVATLSVPSCGYEEEIPVGVLPQGTGQYSGRIEEVIVPEVVTGEPTRVSAVFNNDGDSVVTAKLTGVVVTQEGTLLAVIDSDSLQVLPQQSVTLEDFVNIPPGDNIVRVKVLYEGIVSEEYEVLVSGAVKEKKSFLPFVFGGIIFVLLLLILRKRK